MTAIHAFEIKNIKSCLYCIDIYDDDCMITFNAFKSCIMEIW